MESSGRKLFPAAYFHASIGAGAYFDASLGAGDALKRSQPNQTARRGLLPLEHAGGTATELDRGNVRRLRRAVHDWFMDAARAQVREETYTQSVRTASGERLEYDEALLRAMLPRAEGGRNADGVLRVGHTDGSAELQCNSY